MYRGTENARTAKWISENKKPCIIVGYGESMTPILQSGQPVIVAPVLHDTTIRKNDIVFCRVNGHYYLHKVYAVKKGDRYTISNNHGHINGTIGRRNIFGLVIRRLKKLDIMNNSADFDE